MDASSGPLRSLRVLDLTAVISGPYASQILAEMGADVIKVESPSADGQRMLGPQRHLGMGPIFMNSNRGKRSIGIDLKHPKGRELLLRLARDSDVLLYNVRPQAMERLGLSYETLREVNPRIIYAGLFGFGQSGPYAARPAYDDLIQGASGLASMVARKTGGAPQYVPLAIADRSTGLHAAIAVLSALVERNASGIGQRVDVPMFENMVGMVLADHMGGLSFTPALDNGGYARLLAAGRRPYKTLDGYVCAMVFNDEQWRRFYRLLGREEELEHDPRLASISARNQHIEELYGELEKLFATRSTAEWLKDLEEADIPSMPLHDIETLFNDPHLQAIGFFEDEVHPSEGRLRRMRHPNTWSRTQPAHQRPAPRHGEHCEEILREIGLTAEEIAALWAGNVLAASEPGGRA